ncbi:MAG: YqeG family HAD IIIA-type phosphatase [Clostridia bacterium]|nr:YqeG family HAD IIIA-type phosphatase [Clostridia bacterium]
MLVYPDLVRKNLVSVTQEDLRSLGAKVICVDADNTCIVDATEEPLDGVKSWFDLRQAQGFEVVLLSNGGSKRIENVAKKLEIDYAPLALKPLPFSFFKQAKLHKCKKSEIVMIGDRIFTDILGANIAGCKSIFVYPYKKEERIMFFIKTQRRLERKILAKYSKNKK